MQLAEKAYQTFNSATKKVSLVTICNRLGAKRTNTRGHTVYEFSDNSIIRVKGRGRSHHVEVFRSNWPVAVAARCRLRIEESGIPL